MMVDDRGREGVWLILWALMTYFLDSPTLENLWSIRVCSNIQEDFSLHLPSHAIIFYPKIDGRRQTLLKKMCVNPPLNYRLWFMVYFAPLAKTFCKIFRKFQFAFKLKSLIPSMYTSDKGVLCSKGLRFELPFYSAEKTKPPYRVDLDFCTVYNLVEYTEKITKITLLHKLLLPLFARV